MLQKYKTKKFYDLSIAQSLGKPVGGGTYTFLGSNFTTSGLTLSSSINLGVSVSQMLVLASGNSAGGTITACTVGGVSLTAVYNTAGTVAMFVGAVALSGAQTVSVTYSTGTFNAKGFSLWSVNGLASTTAVQVVEGASPISLTVAGGDLMFSVSNNSGAALGTYTSSTQQPFATHDPGATFITTADWTINSNNVAFSCNPTSAGGSTVLTVTWH